MFCTVSRDQYLLFTIRVFLTKLIPLKEHPVKLPDHYLAIPDKIGEGPDGKINYMVADRVKNRSVYSECSAFGINGKVWWCRKLNVWSIEIVRRGIFKASLTGETIEDLMDNIRKYAAQRSSFVTS